MEKTPDGRYLKPGKTAYYPGWTIPVHAVGSGCGIVELELL